MSSTSTKQRSMPPSRSRREKPTESREKPTEGREDPTETNTFFVGSDGGLWRSTNGGSSFQNANGNMNITQFYAIGVDPSDPERICGGAQDNSSLARDHDNVWERQAVTGDGFVCQLDPNQTGAAQLTYSTFLGGSGEDVVTALAVDGVGTVTAVGWARSNDFPTTAGAFATKFGGGYSDAFLCVVNPRAVT